MRLKAVTGIVLTALLLGMLTLGSNIQIVKAVSVAWTAKTSMPTARGYLFRGRPVIGEKIYVVGGWSDATGVFSKVEIYDVSQDLWAIGTPLPAPRLDGAVQVVDDKLYVIGGNSHGGGGAVPTVWEYDPILNVWTPKTPMPTGRRSLASAVVNGKIYTISGVDTENMLSNTVEMYDPTTNTWTAKRSHPLPRQYLTAEAVSGKIYTFGGNKYADKVHEYDPVSNMWVERPSVPISIEICPNSVAVANRIFIVGTYGSRTVMIYWPPYAWGGPLEDIPTGRSLATTAEVNGRIYVIGGRSVTGVSNANEEGTLIGAVGGIVVPVDELGLLAPYIGLVSIIVAAPTAITIYVKRRQKK